MKPLPLIFALIFFLGCAESTPTTATEAASEEEAQSSASAKPSESSSNSPLIGEEHQKPIMRQSVKCCGSLKFESAVKTYTVLGGELAKGVVSAESRTQLVDALEKVQIQEEDKNKAMATIIASLKDADLTDLAFVRQIFGDLSELILNHIQETRNPSGLLDLAFGYSRKFDRHWLQEGVEPNSPYGDDIASYSWGTRVDVKAYDKKREEELGNTKLGANP